MRGFRFSLSLLTLFISCSIWSQGIGISETGSTPHESAILDIESTDKGLLPPRMTTSQRNQITLPATGLTIYNIDENCLQSFDGNTWKSYCEIIQGEISQLNCSSYTLSQPLLAIEEAHGIRVMIPYTGGNGGIHSGQVISSTGTTGYTASLEAGNFASGNGFVTYIISGTPNVAHITTLSNANFSLSLGGQNCVLSIPISCYSSIKPTTVRDVMNPVTGRIWMDRNLGASRAALSSTDIAAYGDLYQWGRYSDGHQCRSSSTTPNLSSTDIPGHGDFITNSAVPNDWRAPQNNNLWQGLAGVNNPCPAGYRVPTQPELLDEKDSWQLHPINSSDNATGAFASPLKLTLTGFRGFTAGALVHVGTDGYYSSSLAGIDLRFNANTATFSVGSFRASGLAVRCIKD